MKKLFTLLAVIFMTLSLSAQMYIWKNGEIVGEFDVLDVDSVTFVRKIVKYQLTLTVNDATMGTVSGAGEYVANSEVEITATANEGYIFAQWSDGNTENPRKITVTQDTTLEAKFEAIATPDTDYELRILTFEDKDAKFTSYELTYCEKTISTWSNLIEEYQYGGPMLYGSSGWGMDEPYYWYDQNNTELKHVMPYNFGQYCYMGGGHAISNYASLEYSQKGDYLNQLTVYGEEGKGGNNGSANFAMHFGYIDGSSYNKTDALPSIAFGDGKARVIDHMYINVSTYLLNCILKGNGLTDPVGENDWVKLVATGWDAEGNMTGSSVFVVCEGGTDNIITEWTKWDLSLLGKVVSVQFNVTGSNDNGYGFSQPAYFAYDDVAVRFEKTSNDKEETTHEYVDLGLSVKWATCNVGATKPEEYGSYFAWGETQTKETYSWSTYKYCEGSKSTLTKYCVDAAYGTVDNKTSLDPEDDAATANWGGEWRMPTAAEQQELLDKCTWTWTTENGVNGYRVTSKVEGYTDRSIFLPAAGCIYEGDDDPGIGVEGYYWSSSLNNDLTYRGHDLDFWYYQEYNDLYYGRDNYNRYRGHAVRPVCK